MKTLYNIADSSKYNYLWTLVGNIKPFVVKTVAIRKADDTKIDDHEISDYFNYLLQKPFDQIQFDKNIEYFNQFINDGNEKFVIQEIILNPSLGSVEIILKIK